MFIIHSGDNMILKCIRICPKSEVPRLQHQTVFLEIYIFPKYIISSFQKDTFNVIDTEIADNFATDPLLQLLHWYKNRKLENF